MKYEIKETDGLIYVTLTVEGAMKNEECRSWQTKDIEDWLKTKGHKVGELVHGTIVYNYVPGSGHGTWVYKSPTKAPKTNIKKKVDKPPKKSYTVKEKNISQPKVKDTKKSTTKKKMPRPAAAAATTTSEALKEWKNSQKK
jgi:hypothetical protein